MALNGKTKQLLIYTSLYVLLLGLLYLLNCVEDVVLGKSDTIDWSIKNGLMSSVGIAIMITVLYIIKLYGIFTGKMKFKG